MIVLKPNAPLAYLEETLENVQIITGGYVTGEERFDCQVLEKVGTSGYGQRIDFYVNENHKLFSFHYGQSLGSGRMILAIDYFPDLSMEQVNKAFDLVMGGIRKHRLKS